MDRTHIDALELHLSHERDRLARARKPQEIALRKVWCAQLEREVSDERARLGIEADDVELSDDDLLAELLG